MPRCAHEPKAMSSQGDMPDSKEGFWRTLLQRFWRVAGCRGGVVGMAWRNGTKRRDHRNSMANIADSIEWISLKLTMLCRAWGWAYKSVSLALYTS